MRRCPVLLATCVACGHAPALRYQISGRLLDRQTQAPVGGALVIAPEIGDTTETGPDGRFVLHGQAVPQCYRLQVITPSHVQAELSVNLLPEMHADIGDEPLDSVGARIRYGRTIRCNPPGDAGRWDWTVAYGTIRGRVTTAHGLLRAGQEVRTDCPARDTVRTDRAGYYRLDLRVPYTDRARLEPNGTLVCRVWIDDGEADSRTLVVRFGPTPWANRPTIASFGAPRLRSLSPVVLTGRLTSDYDSRPLGGATVGVPDLNTYAETTPDGAFTLRFRSPPGCVHFVAHTIGFDPGTGILRLDGVTRRDLGDVPMQPAYQGGFPHQLAGVQDGCKLSSALPPTHPVRFGLIMGRITHPRDGTPVRGGPAHVCGGALPGAITDENGFFVIDIALGPWIADSVRTARRWSCYLGSVPLRIPLTANPLSTTPVVLDDTALQGGRRR